MKTMLIGTCLLIMLNSFHVLGQGSEKEIIEEFFTKFEADPIGAFDYAFSTNVWMARNVDGVENLKNQFSDLLPLVGDYYGYDKITEKQITERLKLISYMVRYDRQPLRFTFVMYKPDAAWQVQNLYYDDSLPDELKESASQGNN